MIRPRQQNPRRPGKIFWRICGIGSLVEYPEKTDGLEQRQAAGKPPGRIFFCPAPGPFDTTSKRALPCSPIDPSANFSLSSPACELSSLPRKCARLIDSQRNATAPPLSSLWKTRQQLRL